MTFSSNSFFHCAKVLKQDYSDCKRSEEKYYSCIYILKEKIFILLRDSNSEKLWLPETERGSWFYHSEGSYEYCFTVIYSRNYITSEDFTLQRKLEILFHYHFFKK